MCNPLKAEIALEAFERSRGSKARWTTIDLGMIKKVFTSSLKLTTRDREVQMDQIDYCLYREPRVGAVKAKEELQAIAKNPKAEGFDFEGEGPQLKT